MNAARCKNCGHFTSEEKIKHLKTVALVDAVNVTVYRTLCPDCFKTHVNGILEKQKAINRGALTNYPKKKRRTQQ